MIKRWMKIKILIKLKIILNCKILHKIRNFLEKKHKMWYNLIKLVLIHHLAKI